MALHCLRVSFGLFAFIALLACGLGEDECTPSCEGQAPGSIIADPIDCHNYYGCLYDGNVTDTPFVCEEGYFYNPNYGECTYEGHDCEPTCPKPTCSLTCHEKISSLVYPGDCGKYQTCSSDGLTTQDCPPETPYFDGYQCQTDPELCCNACEVECNYAGTLVVDPFNCTNFYFCDTISYTQGNCPRGKHFDPIAADCVLGTNCENVCDASDLTTPVMVAP